MSADLAIKKLTSDKEIAAKIFLQLSHIKDAIRVDEGAKARLFQHAIEVARKLESVKYHRDNLLRICREELTKLQGSGENSNVPVIDLATGAEKEVEAFLMQGKSCLDLLVKIFEPLLGIKLHSYGQGGDRVLKALRNRLKGDEARRAQPLIDVIEDDQGWIHRWFKRDRDTITHYKTLPSSGFVGVPDRDGLLHYRTPTTLDGISFEQLVQVLYQNLLTFCEDFLALAASIKFHPGIVLGSIPEEERDKEHPLRYGMFMRQKTPTAEGAQPESQPSA